MPTPRLIAAVASAVLAGGSALTAWPRDARADERVVAPATAPADAGAVETTLGRNITFRFASGRLSARWTGNAQDANDRQALRRPTAKLLVQSAGLVRIGRGDMTFASILRQGTVGGPAGNYQLQCPKAGGRFTLNAQNLYTPTAGVYSLEVTTDGERYRVTVSRTVQGGFGGVRRVVVAANVRDLRQLAADHPAETRAFVAPALLELTGIDCFPPDAGDVYRAFDTIEPDPAVAAKFAGLLPALDADTFADRSRAAQHLLDLGPEGVLAALRSDRRGLSATQRAAVDGFVADHTLDEHRPPAEARRDPEFLIQCCAYPDPAVRTAARAALRSLAGRDLELAAAPVDAVALRGALLDVIYPGVKVDADPADPDPARAFAYGFFDAAAQREQMRQQRAMEPQLLARFPKGKTYARRGDLLDVRRVNGLPQVRWSGALTVNTPTRVGFADASGSWVVYRAGEVQKGNTNVMMVWSDARRDGDQGPWKVSLNFSNDYFAVNAQYGENASVSNVSLNVVNGRIMFTAGRNGLGQPAVQANAETFRGLAAQQPEAVRKYIAPILRDLFGLYFAPPEPGLVYAVFDELPADASVARELGRLVPSLDAAAAADRDAAGKALDALGLPGVVAVLRLKRDGLTFEQENRLNAFAAAYGWRGTAPEDRTLRADVPFLLACLEFDDPAVRTAAKRALEAVAGPVEIDLTLGPEPLAAAVEALRAKLQPPPAATKPIEN